MLSTNSKLLVRVLTDIRRALGLQKRGIQLVQIRADRDSVTVSVATKDASMACQLPISVNSLETTMSMNTFADLHASARQNVSFNRVGNEVVMDFRDVAGIPSSATIRDAIQIPPTVG